MSRLVKPFAHLEALEKEVQDLKPGAPRDRLILRIAEMRESLDQIRSGRLTRHEIKEAMFTAAELVRFALLFLGH